MAASSNVTVTLTARDLITPTLARLRGGFGGLGSFANAALTGISTAVATQAIDVLIGRVEALKDSFADAFKAETTIIGSANSLSAVSGLEFSKAMDIAEANNLRLSKIAAALPGDTQDYLKTYNGIQASVASGFGKLDTSNIEAFNKQAIELTKNITLLSQISGSSSESAADFSNGAISGTRSIEELRDLDFGTKNPIVMTRIEEQLKQRNKSLADWQKISKKERLDIFNTVMGGIIDPAAQRALQNSVEGRLAALKSELFDLDTGIFGVARKIKEQGGRSVVDSIRGLLETIQVFSGTFSEMAKSLGFSLDPMSALIGSIDWFNDKLVELNNFFRGILEGDPIADFNLSEFVGSSFRWLLDGVRKLVDSIQWRQVGQALGSIAGTALAAVVRLAFDPRSYVAIINLASELLKGVFNLLVGTLEGIFASAWDSISNTLGGIVQWFKDIIQKVTSFNPLEAIKERAVQANPITLLQEGVKDTWAGVKQLGGAIMAPLSKPDTVSPEAKPVSSTSNNYQVTVAATTGASPEEIARTVMAAISGGYTSYRSNSLTA